MAREKEGYRPMLEQLIARFPDRLAISPEETAQLLGCSRRAVYSAISRVKNPMPAKKMGDGKTQRVLIPLTELARWLV